MVSIKKFLNYNMQRNVVTLRIIGLFKEIQFDHEARNLCIDIFQDYLNLLKIKWKLLTRYYWQVDQEPVFGHYLENPTQNNSLR